MCRRADGINAGVSVAGKWRRITRKVRLCFPTKGNYPWIQLAGHAGGFKPGVDPNWILKLANSCEKVRLLVVSRGGRVGVQRGWWGCGFVKDKKKKESI